MSAAPTSADAPPLPYRRLNPPERTLLGPDLSNASPRARQGSSASSKAANDPGFLAVLDEAVARLRQLWRTGNEDTFLVPGSEETALEAALMNVLQPGETAVVAVSGFFGERMADAAERCGAQVIRVAAPPGEAVSPAALEEAMSGQATRLLAVLHGEGSTGVQQPLEGLGALVRAHDALLLVDSRWTISAVDVPHDELGIDVGVAGSQKAISAYPGLGLITFSERAAAVHKPRVRTAGRQPLAGSGAAAPLPRGRARRPDHAGADRLRADRAAATDFRAGHGIPREPHGEPARRPGRRLRGAGALRPRAA